MADVGSVLKAAGIDVSGLTVSRLNLYGAMLLDWNRRMDLTSVSEDDTGIRHFLDSLLPLREDGLFPEGARIIDVGSGAGFPGLRTCGNVPLTFLQPGHKKQEALSMKSAVP